MEIYKRKKKALVHDKFVFTPGQGFSKKQLTPIQNFINVLIVFQMFWKIFFWILVDMKSGGQKIKAQNLSEKS